MNFQINIQSMVVNCPEISAESQMNYVYKEIPVKDECCSKHQVVSCKVGDKEYQVCTKEIVFRCRFSTSTKLN